MQRCWRRILRLQPTERELVRDKKDIEIYWWCLFPSIWSEYINYNRLIGLMSKVFANGSGDQSSIQGRHTKDFKMVLDTSLLNSQHDIVRIKGKVE